VGEVERIGVKIESVYKIERIKTQTEVRPRYVEGNRNLNYGKLYI
jgi:hypothetical protein